MDEGGSPLVDSVSAATAEATGAGHLYLQPPVAGLAGSAVALNDNGSWQLDPTESAPLRGLANDFTVAGWIRLDSATMATKTGTNTQLNRFIGDDEAWDGDGWAFGVFDDGRLRFTKNGVVDLDTAGSHVSADSWMHLAATVSSTAGVDIYVDGSVVENFANTADVNTGLGNNGQDDPYAIGRAYGSGESQWFAGSIDEVYVYDTVLSQEAIANLATVPEPSGILLGLFGALAMVLLRRR
jgi:hypothetical protein